MSCPFFDTSVSALDLLIKGSPPLCATGEGAEMKREHKEPSEVLPSPVHMLCGFGIGGVHGSSPCIFAFTGISLSLKGAERSLQRFSQLEMMSV